MHELARHPEQIQKLREELAPYMPDPTTDVLHQDIATGSSKCDNIRNTAHVSANADRAVA